MIPFISLAMGFCAGYIASYNFKVKKMLAELGKKALESEEKIKELYDKLQRRN